MKNLKEAVLEYMQQKGSITQLEATRYVGTTRLSAVIFNLRKEGYSITNHTERAVNRYGRKISYIRYYLN